MVTSLAVDSVSILFGVELSAGRATSVSRYLVPAGVLGFFALCSTVRFPVGSHRFGIVDLVRSEPYIPTLVRAVTLP